MAQITTIGGRTIDPEDFYRQALATAQANHAHVAGAHTAVTAQECARAALQEAHSALSQAAFFAALDALGGQQAVVARLVRDMGY